MNQTNGQFFNEKLSNLIAYCKANLVKPIFADFTAYIQKLQSYSIADALAHFAAVVAPMGVSAYVDRLLAEFQLTRESFEKEHLAKLEQYLECFVSIVTSPFQEKITQ